MLLLDRLRWQAAPRALPVAVACILILPLALLYARALAEILIGVVDALFLLHVWAERNRRWHRSAFVWASGAWWLWQILCSIIGTGGIVLALVACRLPLFAVALGEWGLRHSRTRRILWWVLAACVAWIILESWQQALFGANLFGHARWGDGALTGPFNRPRAGPALILILYPVLVPAAAWLLSRRRLIWRIAAGLLAGLGVASVLLIGQRMPSVLALLGLALTAALLPRLSAGAAAAAILGALLVCAMPVMAPDTYHKLITRTQEQLDHFVYSPYGEIWVRATVLAKQHPWTGLGFDGFRRGCNDPHAIQGLPELGVTLAEARISTDACNIHPHNYYLEAADNGGLPLLACFVAMVAAAWRLLARGVRRGLDPLRVGLLVAVTLAFWPVASTSAFTSMPNAGWIFLLLGFGFAEEKEKKTVLF
jgi:O-antigen ligase